MVNEKKYYMGLDFLDFIPGGMYESNIITITATAGAGESTFLRKVISNMIKLYNESTIYINFEDGKKKTLDKLVALHNNNFDTFKETSAEELDNLINKFKSKYHLTIYDDITMDELEKEIVNKQAKFVFIDYVQLMEDFEPQKIKEIAEKHKAIIFIVNQMSQDGVKEKPTLSDIEETLMDVSDRIFFLYNRRNDQGKKVFDMKILKDGKEHTITYIPDNYITL